LQLGIQRTRFAGIDTFRAKSAFTLLKLDRRVTATGSANDATGASADAIATLITARDKISLGQRPGWAKGAVTPEKISSQEVGSCYFSGH
jgi:hypothetical protein